MSPSSLPAAPPQKKVFAQTPRDALSPQVGVLSHLTQSSHHVELHLPPDSRGHLTFAASQGVHTQDTDTHRCSHTKYRHAQACCAYSHNRHHAPAHISAHAHKHTHEQTRMHVHTGMSTQNRRTSVPQNTCTMRCKMHTPARMCAQNIHACTTHGFLAHVVICMIILVTLCLLRVEPRSPQTLPASSGTNPGGPTAPHTSTGQGTTEGVGRRWGPVGHSCQQEEPQVCLGEWPRSAPRCIQELPQS